LISITTEQRMDHQDEYFDNLVTMLELIWGEGYMTPGGSDNVEKMFMALKQQENVSLILVVV